MTPRRHRTKAAKSKQCTVHLPLDVVTLTRKKADRITAGNWSMYVERALREQLTRDQENGR